MACEAATETECSEVFLASQNVNVELVSDVSLHITIMIWMQYLKFQGLWKGKENMFAVSRHPVLCTIFVST